MNSLDYDLSTVVLYTEVFHSYINITYKYHHDLSLICSKVSKIFDLITDSKATRSSASIIWFTKILTTIHPLLQALNIFDRSSVWSREEIWTQVWCNNLPVTEKMLQHFVAGISSTHRWMGMVCNQKGGDLRLHLWNIKWICWKQLVAIAIQQKSHYVF